MHMMGWKTWRHGDPHAQNYAVCSDDLGRINMIYHFYAPCYVEYSSMNKMAKYDWNTFRNYVAFLAGGVAPGTRRPHHDSELISCYHDAFRTWGHYHNNIVLFYHDSPITRSHFMDPTDRAIKGFYCIKRNDERASDHIYNPNVKGLHKIEHSVTWALIMHFFFCIFCDATNKLMD